jgi:gp16 family phage-associated protein
VTNVVPVCTVEEVRDEFRRRGVSVSDWARRKGVSAQLTYRILAGRTVGLRGQSHEISVLLGLKRGVIGSAEDLTFAHVDRDLKGSENEQTGEPTGATSLISQPLLDGPSFSSQGGADG